MNEKSLRAIERALKFPKLVGTSEQVERARPIRFQKFQEVRLEILQEYEAVEKKIEAGKLTIDDMVKVTLKLEGRVSQPLRRQTDAAFWCRLEDKSARDIIEDLVSK